ncbi:ComF family protein [bacterium]|nr:ComF family protein [bacterium]
MAAAAAHLARVIWPRRSLITGEAIAGPGGIEPDLWPSLDFVRGPICARCGEPFEIDVDRDQVCGDCLVTPPAYDRARAALLYGDAARAMVLALKRQGRRDGLALMGSWMAHAGEAVLAEADVLVPVPLHRFRMAQRGFNQSVWLAAALSRRCGVRVCLDALVRRRSTPSQAGLTADGRRRNVQGAFTVQKGAVSRIAGRSVVLVDDVLTTGATVEACARVLKRSGAARVDVLTLARVAGAGTHPI